jgi:N-acetylneuraminic acid mutarotase
MLLLAIFTTLLVLPLSNINAVDTETISWTKLSNMPTSRGGFNLAVVSGKIYAIGGSNSSGDLAINEMYDPATDKWFVKTAMPTARTGFATAVYENKIYVIGGSVGESFTGNVEVYDSVNDTWQTLASMPTPRADLTANVVGDKIYLIGGKVYHNSSPYYTQTSINQVYDIKTNTWFTNTSMPLALQGYASTVIDSKIYVIGGSRQSLSGVDTSTSNLQIYDTEIDKWITGQPLNFPSSYGEAVVTTGVMAPTKIYYVGGFSVETFSDRTQIYDIVNDFWNDGPKMSTQRAYLGLAVVNDIVYAIGGFDGDNWLNLNEELKPAGYGKVPPVIEITSPQQNKTYKNIQIDYKVNKVVSWVSYSLDNNQNVTLTKNTSFVDNIPDGSHSIVLFAKDSLGNIGTSQTVHFTIDNAAPTIIILTPITQTYNTADIILTFVIDKPITQISYSLNEQPIISITGNITIPALPDGHHIIVVYAVDELGNSGSSDEISFTISTFPTFWVAITIVLIIILITSGYLVIKHKKTNNTTTIEISESDE